MYKVLYSICSSVELKGKQLHLFTFSQKYTKHTDGNHSHFHFAEVSMPEALDTANATDEILTVHKHEQQCSCQRHLPRRIVQCSFIVHSSHSQQTCNTKTAAFCSAALRCYSSPYSSATSKQACSKGPVFYKMCH